MSMNGMRRGSTVLFAVVLAAATDSSAEPPAPPQQTDFVAANLDSSVSPGNDFFQYANGGWLKRNPIPPTESTWGIDSLVRNELNCRISSDWTHLISADAYFAQGRPAIHGMPVHGFRPCRSNAHEAGRAELSIRDEHSSRV